MTAKTLNDAINRLLMSAREHEVDENLDDRPPDHQSCVCCCATCEGNANLLIDAARESVAPLIEAARAYRDAKRAVLDVAEGAPKLREVVNRASDTERALLEAARTFEVSHEGSGE